MKIFKSHIVGRIFERYGLLVNMDIVKRMNVLALKSPQLRYTNIHYFEWSGQTIYAQIAGNRIVTVLTRQQAERTQDYNRSKKVVEPVRREREFCSIGNLVNL